ncbi:NAD(P)-binding protein [Aspergillus heteromorphus CBS 117.55]|uniref:NAD(P)-binding protein n=1 Tax=Aspergillus heteromorphus CBS 117.55 TaxID=1448321 RepID=A0A317X2U5_9EURO|nr:NAD(P)-binding protein [Aspergillus heteromorphus CBS 117.55]PWY90870.1 NAD(P)-binding protein [Aspergillus heteromorphus CBS 117.55]
MSLANRIILITGASNGIGKSVAQQLAAAGATIIINYLRDAASANALVNEIGSSRALAVQADVSKPTEIQRLVDTAVSTFGRIDVVIPNAGVLPMRDLASTTEADFDATFAMNVKGPYFLAQEVVKHMPAGGRVVFISSSVTSFSAVAPAYLLYAATKGAIEQMTRVMAKDLAKKGITVNAVAPGPTQTELFLRGKSEDLLKGIAAASPFGRIGQPEEIAGVIAFLSGEGSSWMTGQVVRANGGMAL